MSEAVETGIVRRLMMKNGRAQFGFIARSGGGEDLFFHPKHCLDATVPIPRDAVTFVVREDREHRPMAKDVRRVMP